MVLMMLRSNGMLKPFEKEPGCDLASSHPTSSPDYTYIMPFGSIKAEFLD
jgi:hypothetical protein